jgi:hypothetical protein
MDTPNICGDGNTPGKIHARAAPLHYWNVMALFNTALAAQLERSGAPAGIWANLKRRLGMGEYLGLFLFGLLNPVIESMRRLCAASQFGRVQKQVCSSAVSLGSFSEALALVEPELLERVFGKLVSQCEHEKVSKADRQAGVK